MNCKNADGPHNLKARPLSSTSNIIYNKMAYEYFTPLTGTLGGFLIGKWVPNDAMNE